MENIAIILRIIQLYGQNLHNLVSGPTFYSDHDALGNIYDAAASGYDMVIERMIGLDQEPDLMDIQKKAIEHMSKFSQTKEPQEAFTYILSLEKRLCDVIESNLENASEGTKQLIGEIANQSEARQYKIKQRLKSCKIANKEPDASEQ